MDEPFGAIDPVARARIQDEFRQILRQVRKTVVIVTHDLDEAIKLGDRLAIMRDGRLIQYGTPRAILSHPADAFVAGFVGADGALKRLSLLKAEDFMDADTGSGAAVRLGPGASLRDVLSAMIASNQDAVAIVDAAGAVRGHVRRSAIFSA
jgi:osmoprotectant transport system ATP-binding protein